MEWILLATFAVGLSGLMQKMWAPTMPNLDHRLTDKFKNEWVGVYDKSDDVVHDGDGE